MFSGLLPKPKHSAYIRPENGARVSSGKNLSLLATLPSQVTSTFNSSTTTIIPNPNKLGTALANLHIKSDGAVDYTATIAAANANPARKVQASHEDTIPLKMRYPNLKHSFPRYSLANCPDDSLRECLEETKQIVDRLIDVKNGIDVEAKARDNATSYVSYTPSSFDEEETDRGRTFQIKTYKEDPMLPPKFKLRKNRHRTPSPPPPVLKKTTGPPLTKEEREKWHIPSAVSNWKNNQGFTIALDKRILAAHGGTSDTPLDINLERFGNLSTALESAEKQAREDIKIRNELLKEKAAKQQREKEAALEELARRSRAEKRSYDGDSARKRARY